MTHRIRIAGASGYWGESDMAVPQLLASGGLNYIVFDYLAEITMSIMARKRARDPQLGYAEDFIRDALTPNLKEIARQGVKIISNAGGTNPQSCADAIRQLIKAQGLNLKVGVVLGDDILDQAGALSDNTEMFSGAQFPASETLVSANAYIGAFPIARALDGGADIVITGRCVDSAVTLGACIHEFGWDAEDYDLLAAGSLAGHIIECGPQATGGNYTDWEQVKDTIADIGYPIADIAACGTFLITKPEGTGGTVTVGTTGEQMLYEIGNPQDYRLPDVICNFSQVTIKQTAPDIVEFKTAKGCAAPANYKTCVTYSDGWRISALFFMIGDKAGQKVDTFCDAALTRTRRKLAAAGLPDFTHVSVDKMGDNSHYGASGALQHPQELTFKISVRHETAQACNLLLKEATGLALATPPGMALYTGGRPKASPVIRLFSILVPKSFLNITVDIEGDITPFSEAPRPAFKSEPERIAPPTISGTDAAMIDVPLIQLAFARSGDKGDKSNIGVLPRRPEYAPFIWASLTEPVLGETFGHFAAGNIERFYLPGTNAMNIVLDKALGGGGMASLRFDSQGKSFAQILLRTPISVPVDFIKNMADIQSGISMPNVSKT